MITGFIPIGLVTFGSDGKVHKVKFVEIKRYAWRAQIALDLYYDAHLASHQWTTIKDLHRIMKDRVKTGDAITLYKEVFHG